MLLESGFYYLRIVCFDNFGVFDLFINLEVIIFGLDVSYLIGYC